MFCFRSSQHSPSDSFQVAEGSLPLLETHEVVRLAAFDMFPATGHVEMAAYLRRRRATTTHSASKQAHGRQERQMRHEQGWGRSGSCQAFAYCGCGAVALLAVAQLGLRGALGWPQSLAARAAGK